MLPNLTAASSIYSSQVVYRGGGGWTLPPSALKACGASVERKCTDQWKSDRLPCDLRDCEAFDTDAQLYSSCVRGQEYCRQQADAKKAECIGCPPDMSCQRDRGLTPTAGFSYCCPPDRVPCDGDCVDNACIPGRETFVPAACRCECVEPYTRGPAGNCVCADACPPQTPVQLDDCSCAPCPWPFTNCDGYCVLTGKDHHNCGRCGNECLPFQECCSGVCSKKDADPNCGECGLDCGSQGGVCCGPARLLGKPYCSGLDTNDDCGACGTKCNWPTQSCQQNSDGGYSCECPPVAPGVTPWVKCGDNCCIGQVNNCVIDPSGAHVCRCPPGKVQCGDDKCCSAGEVCDSSNCCPSGQIWCGFACCDPSDCCGVYPNVVCCHKLQGCIEVGGNCHCSNNHCCETGTTWVEDNRFGLPGLCCDDTKICGEFCCYANEDCTHEHCCPTGETWCSGNCINAKTDNNNCGDCGIVCNTAAGKACQNGQCVCVSNRAPCGTICCPSGQQCASGVCAVPCDAKEVAGGNQPDTRTINLGKPAGSFDFAYTTYDVPDQIIVRYEGNVKFDSTCVSTGITTRHVPITYSGSSTVIQVEVLPNCKGGNTSTVWDYTVNCPP
jgi:hypothetical protein